MSKRILVTGSAGFIGFHLCQRLFEKGYQVVGIDNLNDYYDPQLKEDRLSVLESSRNYTHYRVSLEEKARVQEIFNAPPFDSVINLAAQAGVRYSIEHPDVYIESNIVGFLNILEACRHSGAKHLIYASSSSVYGANTRMPFSVHDNVNHPVSLYAATKKSNELMAHCYSNLYNLPTTGLRFFTVYGPYGRPDMALFLFTKAILEGKPINVFNYGKMKRDFTYVDDIVEGVVRLIDHTPEPNPEWNGDNPDSSTSFAPYRLFNIGNNNPVELLDFISAIEDKLGLKAEMNMMPIQDGDVPATYADVSDLEKEIGFKPQTSVKDGVGKFIDWYLKYYNVNV
jgi:UDP-glucuronate 4-epimerase